MKKKTANQLKWITRVVVLAAMLATTIMATLIVSNPVLAATITSTAAGGPWATGSTWSGGVAPGVGDIVVIATTGTGNVTTAGSRTCAGIIINSNANLSMATTNVLTINGDVSGSGIWRGLGATATISLTGNWSFTGTSSGTANSVTFTGTAAQRIGGFTTTGAISMTKTGGTATFTGNVNGAGLTINGNGGTLDLGTGLTHTFTGAWTRTIGTLNGNSSTLKIGGTTTNTGGTFTAGTGTVNYTASGTQTIANVTYNNLTLSGTSAKTFPAGTTTVNGTLSMEGTATATLTGTLTYGPAATLQYNTATSRTVSTNEWKTPFTATGGVIIANTGTITLNGAKVFNESVPLTINNGATLATGNFQLTFGGNFVNNGGTFTAGSSAITIANTSTQSIAGFTTTGAVTMNKTAGTATFTSNASGGALTINGSYPGTLSLGNNLTHTFTGNWTITSTGIIDGGGSKLRIGGNGSSTLGGYFYMGSSTVEYYAGGARGIAGVDYYNLTLSGSGTKTMQASRAPEVENILSMEGTANVSGAFVYRANSTLQYNTSTARTSGAEWITPFTATGGVIIANTGTITLNASKAINASLTINSGATLDVNASNYALTVNGSWINNGTFTQRSGTVTLSGTSPQTMSGATTFYNLTINNNNGLTISNSETISNTLTLTNGQITTGSNTVIIPAAGSVSRTNGYIIGNLQKNVATGATSRTFEVGSTTSSYNPVTVAFGNVTTAGNLTATVTSGPHPNIETSTINSSKDVNEYWSLTNSGVVFNSYSATFTFVSGDILGGANPSNFIVGDYNSDWSYPTVGTKTATSTQATGLTSFGDFVVGEVAIIVPTIDITAPSNISSWALAIGNNSTSGILMVNVSSSSANWYVTAQDLDTGNTNGFMTQWTGSAYNTSVKLTYPMNISGNFSEVTLPAGGNISHGTGSYNYSDTITFKQILTWNDSPGTYRIVVTFIATVN